MKEITWDEFTQVELRVGTVVEVSEFPEARKPAWKLQIDFGEEIGLRKSSAQITGLYDAEDLLGRQVVAVVNFPKKTDRTDHVRMFSNRFLSGGWCGGADHAGAAGEERRQTRLTGRQGQGLRHASAGEGFFSAR